MQFSRTVEINCCPRCGMDHRKIVFHRFKGKPISSVTIDGHYFEYWGWCPTFLEPMIWVGPDEDEELDEYRAGEEEAGKCEDCSLCRCSSEREDTESCADETEQVPSD